MTLQMKRRLARLEQLWATPKQAQPLCKATWSLDAEKQVLKIHYKREDGMKFNSVISHIGQPDMYAALVAFFSKEGVWK